MSHPHPTLDPGLQELLDRAADRADALRAVSVFLILHENDDLAIMSSVSEARSRVMVLTVASSLLAELGQSSLGLDVLRAAGQIVRAHTSGPGAGPIA